MFELRRAKENRATLLNFEDDFKFPLFSLNTINSENPRDAVEKIREILEINEFDSHKNLDYWINSVESLGVLVFEFYDINPEQLRGYALYYDKLPVIGINHDESDDAKKFTLFNELAHLITGKEGINNIDEYYFINDDEAYCSKVACEVFVADDLFKKYVNDNQFKKDDIQRLSEIFNVSTQVIIIKALNLGLLAPDEMINDSNKVNANKKSEKSQNTVQNNAKIALRKNGKYYTRMIIKAYEEELMTDIDAALGLDVSLKVMSEIISIIAEED